MWAGYRSFGDPTGRASGFSGAISLIFTKRGTWATELVKLTRCVPIPSQYAVAVQDRRRITHFRSQIEQGKLPLDKDSKKNLETGRPLDLLPDRTAEAVLPWLKRHQEIDVVSRDRASAYADAVKRALPHATQVADRYHLIQNLREHLQRFFDRKRTCLPEGEDIPLKAVSTDDPTSCGALENQTSVMT